MSIIIQSNKELTPFTTFGVAASAKLFGIVQSSEDVQQALSDPKINSEKLLVLGGGSNLLFTQNFDGLVLKNEIKGIEVVRENSDSYIIRVGAGENWHEFVMTCIQNDWAGVENLSLIPGCAGAAPMQNIGAYGTEIKHVLNSLKAYHIPTGEIHEISAADCKLGYRESIFKRAFKGEYCIVSIDLKLDKTPTFNIKYGAIQTELDVMGISDLTIEAVSKAVIRIRQSKLPDPNKIGNAGSFFKNPVVDASTFKDIQSNHPDMPSYPVKEGNGDVKLAAGWLIDQAGWKGKTLGNYGVHKKQALVLVNYGGALGSEIFDLSENIIEDIHSKFGIRLEREVNIM